jgi:hypothetical protein
MAGLGHGGRGQTGKPRNSTLLRREHLQIKALNATVAGLQLSGAQVAEADSAALRARVAQLEATLRGRDKELERLRWASDGLGF